MQRTLGLQAEQKAVPVQQEHRGHAGCCDGFVNVLKSVKKVSDRAGEIATLADGTKSPEELKERYAAEVKQMIKQAAQTR